MSRNGHLPFPFPPTPQPYINEPWSVIFVTIFVLRLIYYCWTSWELFRMSLKIRAQIGAAGDGEIHAPVVVVQAQNSLFPLPILLLLLLSVLSYLQMESQGKYASFWKIDTSDGLDLNGMIAMLRKTLPPDRNFCDIVVSKWKYPEVDVSSIQKYLQNVVWKYGFEILRYSLPLETLKSIDCAVGVTERLLPPFLISCVFNYCFGVKYGRAVFILTAMANFEDMIKLIFFPTRLPLGIYLAYKSAMFFGMPPTFLRQPKGLEWTFWYIIYVADTLLVAAEFGAHSSGYRTTSFIYMMNKVHLVDCISFDYWWILLKQWLRCMNLLFF